MYQNKGVIFDLDGVIVDTPRFHYIAWRKLANNLGFDISLEQNESLKGVSRVHSLRQILNWGNKEVSEEEFERLMKEKNEDYLSSISSMSEGDLLPGVGKILEYLSEHNIPFALGSASKNARPIVRSLEIHDRFVAIVDGNDVTKAKPDPEVFLIAANKLNLKPEECVVFEDSVAGIEAANKAGMTSIGIGDKKVLEEADFNFADSTEIDIEFLEELFQNRKK